MQPATDNLAAPWHTEPDRVEWRDPATGFWCLILRGPYQALCGYVRVPPHHLWYQMDYDLLPVKCHGGLTFGGVRRADGPPEFGAPLGWYIGFDCAHWNDFSPGLTIPGDELLPYRDIAYVQRECTKIAAQIMRAAGR